MSNADVRGRFIWHELMTTDTDAAGAFYSKVMPWRAQPSGMPGYTLWYSGKTQAGGLMALPEQSRAAGSQPHWLIYVGTPNVDASAADVQRLGGKVLKTPADIPNVGRFAVVSDPQGAAFALYTPASSADGADPSSATPGGYPWHELATTDLNGALGFYTQLFGWEKGPSHDMGGEIGIYQIFTKGGKQIGGMFKAPGAAMPPNWTTYVQVADIDKAVDAAKAAGGRIMNGPHQVPGGSWIAQAMDPQGGTFALIESAPMAAADKPAQPAKAASPAKPKPAPAASQSAPKPAVAPASAAKSGNGSKPAAAAAKASPRKPARVKTKVAAKAAKKAGKKAVGKRVAKAAVKRTAAKRGSAKKKRSAAATRPKAKVQGKVRSQSRSKSKSRARAKSRRR